MAKQVSTVLDVCQNSEKYSSMKNRYYAHECIANTSYINKQLRPPEKLNPVKWISLYNVCMMIIMVVR